MSRGREEEEEEVASHRMIQKIMNTRRKAGYAGARSQ